MDGAFPDRKRGFLDRFRTRRMGVAGAGQILGGTAELHQHAGLMDHFAGLAADDVTAEHAIGLGIGALIGAMAPLTSVEREQLQGVADAAAKAAT